MKVREKESVVERREKNGGKKMEERKISRAQGSGKGNEKK